MDFLSDVLLSDEKKVWVLNVVDECSRKVLLSFAATSLEWHSEKRMFKPQILQNSAGGSARFGHLRGGPCRGTPIILIDHIHHWDI